MLTMMPIVGSTDAYSTSFTPILTNRRRKCRRICLLLRRIRLLSSDAPTSTSTMPTTTFHLPIQSFELMSSDSVERQLYVPVLQRRSHAATTLSNCVPVSQRSLHAASCVPVQRHCAIALVPRHFSMSNYVH